MINNIINLRFIKICFAKKYLLKTSLFSTTNDQNDEIPKSSERNKIKLSSELENQYNQSIFGKIPKYLKEDNITDALKSIFLFKEFLIPNSKKNSSLASLIYKSYFFLLTSRVL